LDAETRADKTVEVITDNGARDSKIVNHQDKKMSQAVLTVKRTRTHFCVAAGVEALRPKPHVSV
jgi:hypothetical protein